MVLVTLKCKQNADGTFNENLDGPALAVSSAKTVSEAARDEAWTKLYGKEQLLERGKEQASRG